MIDRAEPPFPETPGLCAGWRGTPDGRCLWIAPCWATLTGQSEGAWLDLGWLERIHPDDRGALRGMWADAQARGSGMVDLRVLLAGESGYRWLRIQAMREAEADGGQWIATAVDVDDLYRALDGERMRRLALQHRVRNTLAVIRSIARRTAETSDTVEAYRARFDGRIAAFARVQGHVIRAGGRGIDLESLLADELLAHRIGPRHRVDYGGTDVRLSPRLADQLGLALHELIANAGQFGALGDADGRLTIRWWMQETQPVPVLHLDWREDLTGTTIAAPDHEGFGWNC